MELITDFKRIDDIWLDNHPDVRVIGSPTTGVDHIDLEAIGRRGVKFVSLQGERRFLNKITSTAEHTIGMMLSLARNYPEAIKGKRVLGHKLSGKTIGIIGNKGRIGKKVAKIAKALGMKVIGMDRGDDFLDLLVKSDFVTVHIPLHGNSWFLNYSHFVLMKRTAFFINTSRLGVVTHGHLLRALKDGLIQGAATDFIDDPDLVTYAKKNKNLILTPHIGGFTEEDRKLTDDFILKKMRKHLQPSPWDRFKKLFTI